VAASAEPQLDDEFAALVSSHFTELSYAQTRRRVVLGGTLGGTGFLVASDQLLACMQVALCPILWAANNPVATRHYCFEHCLTAGSIVHCQHVLHGHT
jgi:hypothetical protein